MVNVNDIVLILGTYDLPDRLEHKILFRATEQVKNGEFGSFTDVYSWITHFLDNVDSWNALPPTRLDKPLVEQDNYGSLNDFIEDKKEVEQEGTLISQALWVVQSELSELENSILEQVASSVGDDLMLGIDLRKISRNIPIIKRKLRALVEGFEVNGKLLIPKSDVLQFQFTPSLDVIYRRNRTDRRFLTDEQATEVFAAYVTYEGNALEASRHLPYHVHTIRKYWHSMLGKKPCGNTLSPVEMAKVLQAYDKYCGNATEASRHLPHSLGTITKHWKNIIGKNPRLTILTASEIRLILGSHKDFGGNIAQASRALGYSAPTVRSYWSSYGLEIHSRRRLSKEQIDDVVQVYGKFDGNSFAASKELGYDHTTIARHWENHGLELKKRCLSSKQVDTVLEAYETFGGNRRKAAKALGYHKNTIERYWIDKGLMPTDLGESTLPPEQVSEINGSYRTYHGRVNDAVAHLPFSRETIRRQWMLQGFEINDGKQLHPGEIRRIEAAHETYDGNAYQCAKYLPFCINTILKYWRLAELPTGD